jgi:hypothetical protein
MKLFLFLTVEQKNVDCLFFHFDSGLASKSYPEAIEATKTSAKCYKTFYIRNVHNKLECLFLPHPFCLA